MFSLRSLRRLSGVLLAATLTTLPSPANAAPGSLDPSFGVDGWVVTELGGMVSTYASAVAVQPDGRIVVAGSAFNRFMVVRYLPDGTLDPSFGDDGIVTTAFEQGPSHALAVALQSDGRLVVAGYAGRDTDLYSGLMVHMAVATYLPDGQLDPSFGGGDGKKVVPSEGEAFDAHVNPDGTILLGGCSPCGFDGYASELVGMTQRGTLDASFGTDGRIRFPGSFTTDFYLSDDELIAVFPIGRGLLKVMRFNHDGTLDPTFGGDGMHNYYAFSTSNPQVTVMRMDG